MNTESRPSGQHASPWLDAKALYQLDAPPAELEAQLLAQFGKLRVQDRRATNAPLPITQPTRPSRWQRLRLLTRFHPMLAGGVSLCVGLLFAAPWWSQSLMTTPEFSTPFMLVGAPNGGRIDVAQMVRVTVAREAMLDFGIPVPPQNMQETVRAEMLLGQRGELLAVRFMDVPAKKRWRFD